MRFQLSAYTGLIALNEIDDYSLAEQIMTISHQTMGDVHNVIFFPFCDITKQNGRNSVGYFVQGTIGRDIGSL